jgi:hypothetical protein
MFLRGVILSMRNTLPAVPRSIDLSPRNVDAPVALYNFLVWLLGGCVDGNSNTTIIQRAEASEDCHRHAISILQDLVHCTTHGRIRTCKRFALPLTVNHLTNSQQIVTILNKFGHVYSATKLLEYKTALAEDLLEEQSLGSCYIPSNIDREASVIF